MTSSKYGVSIKVHPSFFDNVFEKKRKNLQKKLHITNLTQVKFTEYLAKNNVEFKLKIPKKLKPKNPIRGRKYYGSF